MRGRFAALVASLACAGALVVAVPEPAAAAVPVVSIGGGSVVEGQVARRYIRFPVVLSNPSTTAVSVSYTTSDASATTPGDYKAKSGTITFSAGQTTKFLAVLVWPDSVDEPDENFTVTLTSAVNATVGVALGTGTIIDDDPSAGPRVSIGDSTVPETCAKPTSRAPVVVTLSGIQSVPVTVNVATVGGSATSGGDFTPVNKNITFSADQNLKEIRIPIVADPTSEGVEHFTVSLTVLAGPVPVGRAIGTVTIIDCATI